MCALRQSVVKLVSDGVGKPWPAAAGPAVVVGIVGGTRRAAFGRGAANLIVRHHGGDSRMKLFERLGISDPGAAAMVTLQEYASNRSVALLLRSESGALEIGSGTCVRIGGHLLVATAAHNLTGSDSSHVEVVPAGDRTAQGLRICRMGQAGDVDVAWLELDPHQCTSSRVRFVALDQVAPLEREEAVHACLLQGYPAATAENPPDYRQRPGVESDGLCHAVDPTSSALHGPQAGRRYRRRVPTA